MVTEVEVALAVGLAAEVETVFPSLEMEAGPERDTAPALEVDQEAAEGTVLQERSEQEEQLLPEDGLGPVPGPEQVEQLVEQDSLEQKADSVAAAEYSPSRSHASTSSSAKH
jgi:hypothetical protein